MINQIDLVPALNLDISAFLLIGYLWGFDSWLNKTSNVKTLTWTLENCN